jgi:hypothetical protein
MMRSRGCAAEKPEEGAGEGEEGGREGGREGQLEHLNERLVGQRALDLGAICHVEREHGAGVGLAGDGAGHNG